MPLRVKTQAEPFTDYSKEAEPILARSDEYRRLYRDLERYTFGQIPGRSYLIAGHRGSGKTMLVHKAIEDLLRNSLNKNNRPLFVRLHGPDLLPPVVKKPVETATSEKAEDKDKAKDKKKTAAPKEEVKASAAVEESVPAKARSEDELEIVLTQMMKSLFRAVTNEYRTCYRESILRLPLGPKRDQLLEVASQFDLELTEAITESLTPSRLRNYWERIAAFREGILFTTDRTKYKTYLSDDVEPIPLTATDIGLQEILVLSFLSQAFQVISGRLEEKQSQSDAAKQELSSTLSTAYALKNLFGPIAGLLTGGFVGIQIGTTNPIAAVLLGLLTGAVVSFGFTLSSTRSRSRNMSLESVFIRDRSVATLSSVLPMLVVRMKEIGLAPIFVIDELDKVHDLKVRMQNLVRHLKFLVTENSFSCFLTDRRYLTYLNRQANYTAYAPEYTYFSDRLLVLYPPAELRKFIKNVLEYAAPEAETLDSTDLAEQPGQFEEESEKIAYVILHRSRLHPIDLRRQIDRLSAKTTFTFASSFPSTQYRFEILMQLAIESFLNNDDVQSQIGGNPDSRQVVYDALYYVSRLWEDASETQRIHGFKFVAKKPGEGKPGFILDKDLFSKYLASRCEEETEPGQPCDSTNGSGGNASGQVNLGGMDFDFLFEKVSDLVNLLAKPQKFYDSLRPSKDVPSYIQNALPSQVLLENIPNTTEYLWLYDFSGRYVQTLEVLSVIREVEDGISFIRGIDGTLQTFGGEVSLNTMANLRVIPRTPEWAIVKLALERLSRLMADKREYGLIGADRDSIVEFNGTLRDFVPNLKAAMMCAAIFANEIPGQTSVQVSGAETSTGPRLLASLVQVSQLLQLSASRAEDLQKLNSVLTSPLVGSDVTWEDEWDKISKLVRSSMEKTEPRDPTPIIEAAWITFKNRFTRRFRDGVAQFEPQFEDIFTSLRDVGPGRSLSFDLSTMTAMGWTMFLLRSLVDPADQQIPPWLRVAAALELNLADLADKLVNTVPEDPLLPQWVRDFKLRPATPTTSHRNVLVLATETGSLTTTWKPSMRHGSLVTTVADFVRLLEAFKNLDISKPTDLPIDLVCVELTGNRATLGKLVTLKPLASLVELASSKRGSGIKDIEPVFDIQDVCYLVKETPSIPPSGPPPLRHVVSPKGIDDLIDRLPPSPPTAPS